MDCFDWAQTWYGEQEDAFTLPVATPEGALLLGTRGSASDGGRLAARSTDDGATWTSQGLGEGTDGLGTTNLVVIPPSPDFPAGRIVATGFGGIAYSDDDGRSWQPTALYGGLAYAAWSSARIPAGPYAGRLLVVVERGQPGGEPTGLYASPDGAAWSRIGDIPGGGARGAELLAVPDGAVYVYQSNTDGWPVWRSMDGGQSWANLGPVWTEWPAEPREIVVGPDGRLWAACSGGGFAGFDGGVFRTVLPAVSAENGPAETRKPVAELLPSYPNPSDGTVTLPLVLGTAAEVRVTVFDVLGREVAVLHEGPLAAGEHRLQFVKAGLSAGVYLVRAEGSGVAVSRRLTVLR
ncbi:MAG: T9SS type A sorting domain-containing protein [Bacteroidota bacterium]